MYEGMKYFFRNDFPTSPVYLAEDFGKSYTYIGDWSYGKFVLAKRTIHYSESYGGMKREYGREATPEEITIIQLGFY